jgi:LacI family transcriptional regulator
VIAIGACNAARSLGIDIPNQLSVVGFDNMPLPAWDVFRLTKVHSDLRTLVEKSCGLLLRRLDNPGVPPRRVVIPVQLVLGGTHHELGVVGSASP